MGMISLSDQKHWRKRAEQTLAKAEEKYDSRAKERLLRVAREYDRLANLAEFGSLQVEQERLGLP